MVVSIYLHLCSFFKFLFVS
uniref:Uncharacterized protein n=1 Tax=Arundo donax TaxID=35708 RepID=A0A0A9AUA0_ARUDO